MDLISPDRDASDWQRRARTFAETVLFPHEEELELQGLAPGARRAKGSGAPSSSTD